MTATENDVPPNEPQTQATSPGNKRRGLFFLALGIGVGALALIIVAFIWVLNRGVTEVATMDQMVVPNGWTTGTAPSGDFAFAYSPEWDDILKFNPGDSEFFAALSSTVFVSELGGYWINFAGNYGASVKIVGQTHLDHAVDLRYETHAYLAAQAEYLGDDNPTIVRDESFRSPAGFSGWYEMALVKKGADFNYGEVYLGYICISNGHTVVTAYVGSGADPSEWEQQFEDLARSIVILRAPEDIKGS